MKSIKKIFFLFLIACVLLFFGYYRDFVFKNINALLKARDYEVSYALPSSLQFIEQYSYNTLLSLKWLLTLLFSIVYWGISTITIYLLFKNKRYNRITSFLYLAVIFLSGIFIATGFLFQSSAETMYEFARYLMGMAQSPIILMILIPAFKLAEKDKVAG